MTISKNNLKLNRQTGFTLIEVMVALMILALVAVTATKVSSGYLRTVDGMRTRTLAHFVAQNVATDLQINSEKSWLTSVKKQTVKEQGRQWQVTLTPKELKGSADKNLQRVNIHVVEMLENSDKTGTGTELNISLLKEEK